MLEPSVLDADHKDRRLWGWDCQVC